MHDGAQAELPRLPDQRRDDVGPDLDQWRLRRPAPGHVVEHQLDLDGAERFGLADRLPRRVGSGREAIDARVGRVAFVPPAAPRGEDRSRGEHFRDVGAVARGPGELLGGRDVLRHEPHGRHAPREHRLQVLVGLGVHVGVDQARNDPSAFGRDDFGTGRDRGQRRGRRRAGRHDAAVGHDEQGVRHRRGPGPVDERGSAKDDGGGQQNSAAQSRLTRPEPSVLTA